jgi:glutamate dehydrogenase/leucine dehydrogenase
MTWTTAEVERSVRTRLTDAFAAVWETAERRQTSLRRAAYLLGIERTVEAAQLRGLTF